MTKRTKESNNCRIVVSSVNTHFYVCEYFLDVNLPKCLYFSTTLQFQVLGEFVTTCSQQFSARKCCFMIEMNMVGWLVVLGLTAL